MFEQENRRIKLQDQVQTKSRHLIILNNLKKKEENWNGRFYVQEQKPSESVDKSKFRVNDRAKWLKQLLETQNQFKIPEFHRELFNLCIKSLPKPQSTIQFEIEEMINKKSHIQNCVSAVEARENCLNQLQGFIHVLGQNPHKNDQLIQKCSEHITHLRILSINVVEQIMCWRQYLMKFLINQHTQESIQLPYIYQEENYLFKIKRDVIPIQTSILNQYCAFQHRNDPFFIAITKQPEDITKIVQYISKPLLKRVRMCEMVLLNENSCYKEEKSIHRAIKSRENIKLSPEKAVIGVGKIRPKRPESRDLSLNKIVETTQGQQKLEKLEISPINKQKPDIPKPPDSHRNKPQVSEFTAAVAKYPEHIQHRIAKCSLDDKDVEEYLTQVPEEFQKSWKQDMALMKLAYENQDDSFCLGLFNGKLNGFAMCYLDKNCLNERRIIMSNVSTLDPAQFKESLAKILSHLWNNDTLTELRIQIYHYDHNEQFCANKDITAQLKELGFKWKIVQSINAETRFTVLAIRRPVEIPQSKQFDPLFFQAMYINAKSEFTTKQFQAPACLALLGTKIQLSNENDEQLKTQLTENNYAFNGLKLETQNKQQFDEYLLKNFEQIEQIDIVNGIEYGDEVISSFGKECFRWKSLKLATKDQIIYNHFRKCKDMQDEKSICAYSTQVNGSNVYIIQTDQPNVNIIVYECQEDEQLDVDSIANKLQECQNQSPIQQDLYIPQFIINEQVSIGQNITGIGRFSTKYNPKYTDINTISDEAYIVKAPFIFGLLADDFNDLTNLPKLAFKVLPPDCVQI